MLVARYGKVDTGNEGAEKPAGELSVQVGRLKAESGLKFLFIIIPY